MREYVTTHKVLNLLCTYTKEDLSKKIGISRPTLNARLLNNSWKISEITLIRTL